MNTKCFGTAIFLIFIAIILFFWSPIVESSPTPRRGGGGGRSSGGRSSYSSGSHSRGWGSKSKSSSGTSWNKAYGANKSKGSKKSFIRKHWKKAAAFGAGAYIGHKVSKKV